MKRIEIEITTTNLKLLSGDPEKPADHKGLKIEVKVTGEVPETLPEAAEFYGSETKLMESIQADVARRRSNAARPLLRDADTVLDWKSVAQVAVDDFTPGRKPSVAPSVSEAELAGAENMEQLMAILKARGFKVTKGEETSTEGAEAEGAEVPAEV